MKTCILVMLIILLICTFVACETRAQQNDPMEAKAENSEYKETEYQQAEPIETETKQSEPLETDVEKTVATLLKTADEIHNGDLILNGNEEKIIADMVFNQRGNIYLNDDSTLIIRNATLIHSRGDLPTTHTNFFVAPNAKLIIENCTVFNDVTEVMCHVVIQNQGSVAINNSDTKIHLIINEGYAKLNIKNSTIVNPAGGFIQTYGGESVLENTTIGALALSVPNDSTLNINGLEPGMIFEEWNVHDWIPKANYDVRFNNVTVLEDTFGPGPFDRAISRLLKN
jgi:hypothetical protein